MGTKISDMGSVETLGPNDLFEVAVSDPESATGFSSRSVEYQNMIPTQISCSVSASGIATLDGDGFFTVDFTQDELTSSCGFITGTPMNSLLSGTLYISVVGYNATGEGILSSSPCASVNEVVISNYNGVVRYLTRYRNEVVSLETVVSNVEAANQELLIYGVDTTSQSNPEDPEGPGIGILRLTVLALGFGTDPDIEVGYNISIDYNMITYEAA